MRSFDERVWSLLEKIPKGRVTTYKIIAEKLGTRAYRAVGNACNRNPNAPRVPCHRVVASDGKIGGYANGSRLKAKLLEKEKIKIRKGKVENFSEALYEF
jgi:methylated-DNA-[protein]-cysteine S-methyltransferase